MTRDRSSRSLGFKFGLALTSALVRPAFAGGPTPLSPAWFAARTGSAGVAGSAGVGATIPQMQQVQKSLANLETAMKAVAAANSAQASAAAAASRPPAVPNGLTIGGLQPTPGYTLPGNAATWTNATLKPPTHSGGRTQVTVTQTAPVATLNWTTFNVGAATSLTFDQSAGASAASTWVALNRVSDPSLQPSQILGGITAQGHVLVINANGIIFGAGSQVNVGSLLASTADIATPLAGGIYAATPSFVSMTLGAMTVQAGAQITTNKPTSVTDGGGGVLLFGRSVSNAGSITTPDGQTVLAAAQSFTLTQGYATNGNTLSTTLGTVVSATDGGKATNTGVITATTGDITLLGQTVTQGGVLYSTSSVSTRGTIHLENPPSDPNGSVTLSAGSVTQIAPDPDSSTALNSQRATVLSTLTGGSGSGSVAGALGPATSRIEIDAGDTIEFQGGSLTVANGGQIVATTGIVTGGTPTTTGRIQVDAGATLDVSGLQNVILPASINALLVNVQGFEQRDAPVNRDSKTLNSANVYVDARQLVLVPASAAYPADRYYTPGGLLEVSGELNTVGHSIEEWDTVGGTINLQSGALVAQSGSTFNIAGGSVSYQAGYVPTTMLVGSDGRLFNINQAPANVSYTGVYGGTTFASAKWNTSETYVNPLVMSGQTYEAAYTQGRDGGSLTIGAPTVIFDGQIEAGVTAGQNQSAARPASVGDPFLLPQTTVPLPGSLTLQASADRLQATGVTPVPVVTDVTIGDGPSSVPADVTAPLPAAAINTASFSAAGLSAAGLGGLTINVTSSLVGGAGSASAPATPVAGSVTISGPLTLANGGQLSVTAFGDVSLQGVTARSGAVSVSQQTDATGSVTLAANATLDLRGLFTNEALDPAEVTSAAFVNGGAASLTSYGALTLATGSLIDVSAGAVVGTTGALTGGAGGSVTLVADATPGSTSTYLAPPTLALTLDGQIRGYGAFGATSGGTLSLSSPAVLIGGATPPSNPVQNALPASFFQLGFRSYDIVGYGDPLGPKGTPLPGVEVAAGAAIDVTVPVLQAIATTLQAPTGSDPFAALSLGLPPAYLANTVTATTTARAGASLTLREAPTVGGGPAPGGGLLVDKGASITVDQGQSVTLKATDQLTVLGAITAPGGTISLANTGPIDQAAAATGVVGGVAGADPGLSVWLGPASRLSVAGRAFTADDTSGRPFGVTPSGGTIQIGYLPTTQPGAPSPTFETSPAFIALRPGAVLDASGISATIDLQAGQSAATPGGKAVSTLQTVASDGGSILLGSSSGIYLDGTLRAPAGGAGASGGLLSIALYTPVFESNYMPFGGAMGQQPTVIPDPARTPAQITISQLFPGSKLPTALQPGEPISLNVPQPLVFAQAELGVDQITSGGFASLNLSTTDQITFAGNVTLPLGRQLTLAAQALGDPLEIARVQLSAPYVSLAPAPKVVGADIGTYSATSQQVTTDSPTTPGSPLHPVCVAGPAAGCTLASLTISANQLDVSGAPQFGVDAAVQLNQFVPGVARQATVDVPGFQQVTLRSSGDVRFIGGSIVSAGNVSLIAGQVYAATGETGLVSAGSVVDVPAGIDDVVALNADAVLTIARYPGSAPNPPLSAFGSLTLQAPTIIQGGDVQAPFGFLTFGYTPFSVTAGAASGTVGQTMSVAFLPGSVTSVSGAGLTVPYGGTTDNINYDFNGISILGNQYSPGISVSATQIAIASGALVNLSGGGVLSGGGGESYVTANGVTTLAGQGFVTGRGGSADTLVTPLLSFSGAKLASSAAPVTSSSATQIYAIVPGYRSGYAPVSSFDLATNYAGSIPQPGEQITVPAGVPGLGAGAYTLLPSYYALLPGAYRVQLATTTHTQIAGAMPLLNGSYDVDATIGFAGTGVANPVPTVATLTSGPTLRTYSQYNETTYSSFVVANAALFGNFRQYVPADAGALSLNFQLPEAAITGTGLVTIPPLVTALSVAGTVALAAAPGGLEGTLQVSAGSASVGAAVPIEITGPGAVPTAGYVSIPASALSAIDAPTLAVGAAPLPPSGGTVLFNPVGIGEAGSSTFSATGGITVREGAVLSAGQIFLASSTTDGITLEGGSTLSTIGHPAPSYDSSGGFAYVNANGNGTGIVATQSFGLLALSNGFLDFLPPLLPQGAAAAPVAVEAGARLYTAGTLAFVTAGSVTIDPTARFGAKYLDLSAQRINLGSPPATGTNIPLGLTLTSSLLGGLLSGDAAVGTPPLQDLTLTASGSVNVYGSIDFQGGAGLQNVTLNTPAIYGAGAAADAAVIAVPGTLTWNGAVTQPNNANGLASAISAIPDAPAAQGPGSGLGSLTLAGGTILLGYTPDSQPLNTLTLNRIILGFSAVNLDATQQITANNSSTLSVYQSANPPSASGQVTYNPASLTLQTPLLTTQAGATLSVTTNGPISITAPAGSTPGTGSALGGTIALTGSTIASSTVIGLPSGQLTLNAKGDIALGAGAVVDLSGRSVPIFDQTVTTGGGTLVMESAAGNITLDAAGRIDVSATTAAAGSVSATAENGAVSLLGTIAGGASTGYAAGSVSVRAGTLAFGGASQQAAFSALNQSLTTGGVFGARSFEVATGDLAIGASDSVQAQSVSVSADSGSLTVTGAVNAGGSSPGSIRLSANNALTIGPSASLTVASTTLQTDSDGRSIDAANTGSITLTSAAGSIAVQPGATFDLSSPDGVARGQLAFNVPRVGADGAAISAAGGITVRGAASIAVNAFRTYAATDASGTVTQTDQGIPGSVNLAAVDADNAAFINAAIANPTFLGGIAGLAGPYASVFHLRPGVQITSSAASGGDLSVAGDLDLSGFRYASLIPGGGPNPAVPGSGEPGVLVLRAADNLLISGSVSDGFGAVQDPGDPNANAWQLNVSTGSPLTQSVIVPTGLTTPITLNGSLAGTVFNNNLNQQIVTEFSGAALNYAVQIRPATLGADAVIPTAVTLGASPNGTYVIPAGGFTTTASITLPDNTVVPAGAVLPAGYQLPAGAVLSAGSVLPFQVSIVAPAGSTSILWPAGASFAAFQGGALLAAPVTLTAGDIIPFGTTVGFNRQTSVEALRPTGPDGTQGVVEPLAPLLQGVDSWSLSLVGGANLAAADPRAVLPLSALAAGAPGPNGSSGSVTLADAHYTVQPGTTAFAASAFSVVRTGTGSLDVIAGGSIVEDSAFGIYTAGTQPANVVPPTGGYTPQGGGNLLVLAQQNISTAQIEIASPTTVSFSGGGTYGSEIGNWLTSQGGPGTSGSWAVNFGNLSTTGALSGFIGLGTLGGGNVLVSAGGNAGEGASTSVGGFTGLDVAVASTGGVANGAIVQSGGGNLTLTIGGALNGAPRSSVNAENGTLTDLRGNLSVQAGSIGQITLSAGFGRTPTSDDPRSANPYVAEAGVTSSGGPIVVPGDGQASLVARGDLVLGGAGDAILTSSSAAPATWFTLWRPTTSLSVLSLGGNLTPTTQPQTESQGVNDVAFGGGYNFLYPPSFSAVAASGSIYYGGNVNSGGSGNGIELAPSANGQLQFLAANSIYATATSADFQLPIDISGANPADIPTPLNPAYVQGAATNVLTTSVGGLFAFEADTPTTDAHANDQKPALFYAGSGDIVGLQTGQILTFPAMSGITPTTWYVAGKPVQIEAGRDIVGLGTSPLTGSVSETGTAANFTGSVVFNDQASDISTLVAGRDVIYANESVAGPGLLLVQAGRNVYQGDEGVLESVGPQVNVTPATQDSGAGITILAGVGAAGPAWSSFSSLYLNPANLASAGIPLQDQPGKVVRDYDSELQSFLLQRFGFSGTAAQAVAYFAALPQAQQDVFLLQVYFAELNQAGLDYNDPTSRFYKSYLEGTNAIEALFPGTTNGQVNPAYQGSLTLFSGIGTKAAAGLTIDGGIRTDFGGGITAVVPGGGITVGVEGVIPGSTATSKPGVITQGTGDIDLYSSGSVELGLSRIFTTFGGGILIWSEDGDIAAGAGAKSTVVFAPASITYDEFGDITLSPTVPTTGAGIATLAPIPQVAPGNINLVAPNGVIDAGEAGIRSSGNANFAALLIVNAANIQVQGKVSGLPVIAVPNVAAETAASSVAGSNQQANLGAAAPRQTQPPSVITVEVIGYGGSDQDVSDEERRRRSGGR